MAPRPPASERLDRDQILAGALALADRDGLEALTLRRVAAEWNVTPMALYWHFKDKDALLDAVVDRMLSEIDRDVLARNDIRASLEEMLRVLRGHPALAATTATRIMRTPTGLDLSEHMLGLLRGRGHSPASAAMRAQLFLTTMVALVAQQPGEMGVADPAARESLLAAKRATLKALSPETHPHLVETADFFLHVPDEEEYYARGMTFLLDGA